MKRALIVCYSRTGYTASLAKEIAAMTGWDLMEVRDLRPREGGWGQVRCALEAMLHLHPEIQVGDKRPQDYEMVLLAAPVWMRSLASPMRTYIARNRKDFKELAFVTTYGGQGAERAAQQMAALARKPLKAMLAVTSFELEQADYRARLDAFLSRLKQP